MPIQYISSVPTIAYDDTEDKLKIMNYVKTSSGVWVPKSSNLQIGDADVDNNNPIPTTFSGSTTTITATIAISTSLSAVVDLEGYHYLAIQMPAEWTTADLTFQASSTSGGTFADVYDDAGLEISAKAAASRVIGIDLAVVKLAALRYLKIRSGTTATPVNQAAERTLTLILKG